MISRLAENVLIAAVSSLVTWALAEPGHVSAATADSSRRDTGRCPHRRPSCPCLWLAAVVSAVAGLVLQLMAMSPSHKGDSRQLGLTFRSLPTALWGWESPAPWLPSPHGWLSKGHVWRSRFWLSSFTGRSAGRRA
jgi:hypothetical protein